MTAASQTYATHRRLVPSFHMVLFLLIVGYAVYAVAHLVRHQTWGALANILLAAALGLTFFHLRGFATRLQDRIIRLEETVRYQRCLPGDLLVRANELTLRQMIGLRFASDAELPALVRDVLDAKTGEHQIKKQVKDWRADHLRV